MNSSRLGASPGHEVTGPGLAPKRLEHVAANANSKRQRRNEGELQTLAYGIVD